MPHKVESLTAFTPQICHIGRVPKGNRLAYSIRRGLNHLIFIHSFTCPLYTKKLTFVKTSVIIYGPNLL